MPRASKKSRLAKQQRTGSSKFFRSGRLDDAIELADDSDYLPEASDSEEENPCAFNLMEDTIQLVDISEESEGDDDDEEGIELGKRKRVLDEDDGDYVEICAKKCTESASEFWNEIFSNSDKPKCNLRKPLPTFSGAGRSSIFQKRRDLKKASNGCRRITEFFSKGPPTTVSRDQAPSPEPLDEDSESETSDFNSLPPHEDSVESCSYELRTEDTALVVTEEFAHLTDFLNPSNDDDDQGLTVPLRVILKRLISEAKKFKSFSSLLHIHAIEKFLNLKDSYTRNPKIKNPTMRASLKVAQMLSKGPYFARKIRRLARYIEKFETLPPVSSGKHHAHPSLLNNEQIQRAVRRYLSVLANGEITPLLFMQEINEKIIPGLGLDLGSQKIAITTARRWLVKLGYGIKEAQKGMYVDGHEREDVVEYRKEYLRVFLKNER